MDRLIHEELHHLTPLQLGIIFGARLTLLLSAVALFAIGASIRGVVGQALIVASFVVAALYLVVFFRTRSQIKKSLAKSTKDHEK
jgi:hypothetical protein